MMTIYFMLTFHPLPRENKPILSRIFKRLVQRGRFNFIDLEH
jgi:hypothetical protein